MVAAELRAAERMRKRICSRKRRKLFGSLIYTADGIYYPYLVSYSDFSVSAHVSHESFVRVNTFYGFVLRAICVFQIARKIRFHVMRVNMLALFYVTYGVTYGVAVFYYVFALFYIAERIFMPVLKVNLNIVKYINSHILKPRRKGSLNPRPRNPCLPVSREGSFPS